MLAQLQVRDTCADLIDFVQLYRNTQKYDLDYLDAHPEIQEIIILLLDECEKNRTLNIHRFADLYHIFNIINIKSNYKIEFAYAKEVKLLKKN